MVEVNEVPILSHISIKIGVLIATLHYLLLAKLDLTSGAALFTELFVSAALFLVVFWKRFGDLGVIRGRVYYCIHYHVHYRRSLFGELCISRKVAPDDIIL